VLLSSEVKDVESYMYVRIYVRTYICTYVHVSMYCREMGVAI